VNDELGLSKMIAESASEWV